MVLETESNDSAEGVGEDAARWQCRRGEIFDRQRHASGTEVKAITYSAMDVREQGPDVEIFVIVDI